MILALFFNSTKDMGNCSSPKLIKYSPWLSIEMTSGSLEIDILVVSVLGRFTSIP